MNEIQLSKDINILTAEINSYKQIAGQSIWEIGRRLNYVKENDLAHGEFIEWVHSLNMNEREAQRFMKVTNELPNTTTLSHLGETALYLIATLPEEERTQPHETAKGETKTPDEMTVRELQKLKKQLKAKDKQIDNLSDVINDMSVQQPEVVEKEIVIEKIPDDYNYFKGNYEATKKNYEFFKEQNSQLRDEIKSLEDAIKRAPSHEEVNSLQEQLSAKQERELSINKIYEFQEAIEKFTHDHSSILYSNDLNRMETDRELLISFEDSINHLIEWAEEVKKELPNKNIIEGDVL